MCISFDKRKSFFEMLDEIINNKVNKVIVTYKDILSRVDFELLNHLFKKYRTDIVIISEVGNTEEDIKEIFHDIEYILHYYSMKTYFKRKKNSIEVGYEN